MRFFSLFKTQLKKCQAYKKQNDKMDMDMSIEAMYLVLFDLVY